MVTMSNLRKECQYLKDDIDNELETVNITLSMNKTTFEKFLKGKLSDIAYSGIEVYRDDTAFLQAYMYLF